MLELCNDKIIITFIKHCYHQAPIKYSNEYPKILIKKIT